MREIDSNNRIPDDIVKGMTDMGLWAPTVSEAYGGQGMNVTMATIAAEELGRAGDQPGAAGVVSGGGELGFHL